MAKRRGKTDVEVVKTPPSDCNKCKHSTVNWYGYIDCKVSLLPSANCLERKLTCVKFETI